MPGARAISVGAMGLPLTPMRSNPLAWTSTRLVARAPAPRAAIRAASGQLLLGQQQRQQGHQQQQQQQQQQRPRRTKQQARGSVRSRAAAAARVAAAVCVAHAALPAAASATSLLSALVPHSAQQHQAWQTVCWGCTAAGAASLLVTLVCTSRFLVSYYPGLEREAEAHRWRLPWVAVTLFDPLLQPLRRRFFGQTEDGDLDYAAVALLAVVCSLLECAVGKDGLLLPFIPDFALRDALQYLIVFQHGFLLPLWVMVVLRWGRVI